jgi:hypothetical protein
MKKPLLLALVALVAVASLWSWRRADAPPAAEANRLLADRIWIDHVPKGERDTVQVFFLISEHAIGVFQATSQWRGGYEGFRYEASGADLRILYPQTGAREAVRAKARRCSEQKMDFCLEIEGASRGVKRYYSREGWEIDRHQGLDAVRQRAEALRAQLEAPQ